MAYLKLYKDKLKHNYEYLDKLMKEHSKEWAVVTKLLCGHKEYVEYIINLGVREICDSRISNLKLVKEINPKVETVYIKPPAEKHVTEVVKYADASFNTELDTIQLLSKEATKQKKTHKVVIMIELGDLREGVMGEDLIEFYRSVFTLPHIDVTGIGTNLNCLHGVLPSQDKLIQLSLYEQLIEANFGKKIPWVTGGTSVILPLLLREQVPQGVNHFRIGESFFFGNNLISDEPLPGMETETMKLFCQIIEITEKPIVPIGVLAENPSGEKLEVDEGDFGKTTIRAILDLGLLDIGVDFLSPEDKNIEIVGASSDMMVVDLGDTNKEYQVGDILSFDLKYMGALRLLNSDYIDKLLV